MNHTFLRWRLIACIALSLFVHLAILSLPIVYWARSFANGSSFGGGGQLQVRLRVVAKGNPAEKWQSNGDKNAKPDQSFGVMQKTKPGFILLEEERLPEPLSDIDFGIDDPRVLGFMILSLHVDSIGNVSSVDVIYADIPQEQQEKIVRGFSSALFKPGMKGGVPVAKTILIRVDIE